MHEPQQEPLEKKPLAQEVTLDQASNTPKLETPDSTVQFTEGVAAPDVSSEHTLPGESERPAPAGEATVGPTPEAPPGDATVGFTPGAAPAKPDDDTVGFNPAEGKDATRPGAAKGETFEPPPADEGTRVWTGEPDRTGAWQEGEPKTSGARAEDTQRLSPAATTKKKKPELPSRVAGYEILGELGRGGMGVVYKARQAGLNRLVALKMVLAGGHASSEQLARFRIEAEAIADLQHPNIVQVYEVGEEQGCPFFSLEFIDGDSLAKKIDGAPQPPAEAARMVFTLAQAMHAAHQRGIIHRDLKPANILLTQDGSPKITDFGLAKRFEDKDEGQTRTGAIMGTPSYMSPEQAQGRTKDTGPPADIYSLGAIFYDLLTGRPPFRGATLLDTLQQVQTVEPVPPARLQPSLPQDLETICLKALEKDPAKRYATAGAMAEDLRRYLAGEPILARPTPWWERTWKWSRRRPALATLIGVSTLAAVTVLVLGGLYLDSERQAAEDREHQQTLLAQSEGERAHKETLLREAAEKEERLAKDRAREQAERAEKEKFLRARAEQNFLRAKGAVDFMLSRVGQERLAHVPQMVKIRRELLESALVFYQDFQKEKGNDPSIRWESGRAQQRVADIYQMLGKPVPAQKAYENALVLFSDLMREFPNNLEYQKDLAGGLNNLGNLYKDLKKNEQARKLYAQALDLRKALADAVPSVTEYSQELAESFINLGVVLQSLGKNQDAAGAFRDARLLLKPLTVKFPKNRRYREELARTLNNEGTLLQIMARTGPAQDSFLKAKALLEGLVQEAGEVSEYRQQLALTLIHLGDLWRDTKSKDAEAAYLEALKLREQLARDFSAVPAYREDWASGFAQQAILFQAMGRKKEADVAYARALEIQAQTAADFPLLPEYRGKLASSYNNRGLFLLTQNRTTEGEADFKKALEIFQELAKNHGDVPFYQQELAGTYLNLGTLYQYTGRPELAEDANRQALKLRADLVARFPEVPEHTFELARIHQNLATLFQLNKKFVDAEQAYDRAIKLLEPLLDRYPGNPDYARDLAVSHDNLGNLLRVLNKTKAAEVSWQRARTLLARLAKDYSELPIYQQDLARNLNRFADYLTSVGRTGEAEKALNEALAIQTELLKRFPGSADYRVDLALSQRLMGVLQARLDHLPEAETNMRRAIATLEEGLDTMPVAPGYYTHLTGLYRDLANLLTALNRPAAVETSLLRLLALQEKLAAAFPKVAQFRYDVSGTLNDIASRLIQKEKFADARPHLLQAVRHLEAALEMNRKDPFAGQGLFATHLNLAVAALGLTDHRQAAKAAAAAQPYAPPEQLFRIAAFLSRCSGLAAKDSQLSTDETKKLVQAYADQAMELLQKAVDNGFRDLKLLTSGDDFASLRARPDFQKLVRSIEGKKTP
jgi:tetratricopeptide (TPR) repeat protein/tRNA A-37 threonylcarbamoyl transferase component Bud32